ncbi:atrial natriuretic peptide receptor 3-like [Penaeus japonicus]|uniref:atrial natriuretic peptide receptor 3-like n=1 Tax=Penaeus japonicus TaxID=27405 RepID=UPI001C715523|nr:atrial natriuretic peptide receptor 3-like [Penaeus japonicus]
MRCSLPHNYVEEAVFCVLYVFLGPVDDYVLAPVARFSGVWKVPVLTPGGRPTAFDTRTLYPLLVRLKGFYAEIGRLFSSLVREWDWSVLGLLYQEGDEVKGHSVCYFPVASIYNTFTNKPSTEKFNNTNTNFTEILLRFQSNSRSECYIFNFTQKSTSFFFDENNEKG